MPSNKQNNYAPSADESHMRSYYAARAAEYDNVYLKLESQLEFRAIEKWLSPIFAGANVLEVACGTGYWTKFIAPMAANVVALDVTPETINLAKERVSQEKVQFLVGDAYALPQYDTKFDAAFAGFWFSHVPKQRWREFMCGLYSRLKPEAKVVMLDSLHVDDYNSPIIEHDSEGNTYQRRELSDGTTYRILKNFPSQVELQILAADLDKEVSFTTWQSYWAFTYSAGSL